MSKPLLQDPTFRLAKSSNKQMQEHEGLTGIVQFVGQLERQELARMLSLHHVGVFPSIYPKAFGIVAAEMLASGLVLVGSGVGGASELVEPEVSGLFFEPGNASSLAYRLEELIKATRWAEQIAAVGRQHGPGHFNVLSSAKQLVNGFQVRHPSC